MNEFRAMKGSIEAIDNYFSGAVTSWKEVADIVEENIRTADWTTTELKADYFNAIVELRASVRSARSKKQKEAVRELRNILEQILIEYRYKK